MPLTKKEAERANRPDLPFSEFFPLDRLATFIRRREYHNFVERFRAIFRIMRDQNMALFVGDDQIYFTGLFDLWFKLLETPAFQLAPGDEELFALGANITNILAVTPHLNGDACLKKIAGADGNLAKLLLLSTPRSLLEIPLKTLFDANAALASLWYSWAWNWADAYVDETVVHNCRRYMREFDPRFETADASVIIAFFRCTYVDHLRDREFKRLIGDSVRRFCAGLRIINRPNPRSIAVVSAYWHDRHAVYRAFAPHVEEMARHYDLTLVNMVRPVPPVTIDTSFFKRVVDVKTDDAGRIGVGGIIENDFQAAYFPDVGISQESLYLANMRIAPIQAMGTGHPVSSASPEMDYFISGAEVETPDSPEENYDERLVLLPGLSVHPAKPVCRPASTEPDDKFIVNCPWMHMKNNIDMARNLAKLLDKAGRPLFFHIFCGCGATHNNAYMATVQDYSRILPLKSFRIIEDMIYERYMDTLALGRFSLHSYPFGGGTTAVDALVLGKPLVVLRGRHEYNRYSAALLVRLGLDELIADTPEHWEEIVVRLVNDDAYLAEMTRRVREADLDGSLFGTADADCLRRAFDMLIRRHGEFADDKSREPIRVE